jgi:hypothetical protein
LNQLRRIYKDFAIMLSVTAVKVAFAIRFVFIFYFFGIVESGPGSLSKFLGRRLQQHSRPSSPTFESSAKTLPAEGHATRVSVDPPVELPALDKISGDAFKGTKVICKADDISTVNSSDLLSVKHATRRGTARPTRKGFVPGSKAAAAKAKAAVAKATGNLAFFYLQKELKLPDHVLTKIMLKYSWVMYLKVDTNLR